MINIYEDILALLRQDNPLEKICEEITEQINEADKKFKVERIAREQAKQREEEEKAAAEKLAISKIEHCREIGDLMSKYFDKFYPDLPRGDAIDPQIIVDLLENSAALVREHNVLVNKDPETEEEELEIVFTPEEGATECGSGELAVEESKDDKDITFYGSYESYEKVGDEPAKVVKKTFTSPEEADKTFKKLIANLRKNWN